MYAPWFLAWMAAAALAGLQFAILTWGLWENRRFVRARLRKVLPRWAKPRVALFAPCKGLDVGIIENLRPLLEQDYGNYTLTFIVESGDDPVCRHLRRLIDQYPNVDARLCVAGLATDTGQKVHNLRRATTNLPEDVEVLAFVDSDARPGREWLRRLAARLPHAGVGAVTGYRWFSPTRASAAQSLLYSINSMVAAGFGPGGHHLVWGGSWAIRRTTFESLGVRDAWQGTLSDDLVATGLIHRAGLRVDFEPACMVTSPVDGDWRQTLEFVRRQYVIARSYALRWWLLMLVGATLPVLTFWGGLLALVAGVLQGAEWIWLPAVICPAYYAATLVRGYQRWLMGRLYLPEQPPLAKRLAWLDIWTGPLVMLANWLAIVSSLFGSRLQWRGVGYRLGRGGRIVAVERSGIATQQNREESTPREDGLPRSSRRRNKVTA